MTDQTLIAARDVRDAFIGEHADETYLERVHGRDRERDDARDAEPLPPPSKRRWVPKETWDAYVARGELVGRPTPRWSSDEVVRLRTLVGDDGELGEKEWKTIAERLGTGRTGNAVEQKWAKLNPKPAVVEHGPPKLGTKRDPVDDLRGFDLYTFDEAFRVLYTKEPNTYGRTPELALAAFKHLSEYEDEGPEDGSFEGIDVRSELKARAEGVDVFFYDKDQETPFDEGVEVRWQPWSASTIYLAPHPDEENAVAAVTLRTTHRGGEYHKNGHVYALVKPKAGGDQRDFEFANYPAFLIVARD